MLSTELLAHYRQWSQALLTIVDVETTGRKPAGGRVIEISVLQATLAQGIQNQQTHLINPEVLVPEAITHFTGISQEMVDAAPLAAEVWPQYWPLLSTGVLTAHNLAFDYGFIRAEFDRLHLPFLRPTSEQFCTVLLSRLLLSDLPSRRLPDLVQHFGFAVGPSHRAEADTLACWLLAERLLTEVMQQSDATLLAQFAQQRLTLEQAANLLGCSRKRARSRLTQAGIESIRSDLHNSPLYRRGDVEQVLLAAAEATQLSWL